MELIKRTFEAKKYPKGSEQRKLLNAHTETSEYMPSYRYVVILPDGYRQGFTTKREAQEFIDTLK